MGVLTSSKVKNQGSFLLGIQGVLYISLFQALYLSLYPKWNVKSKNQGLCQTSKHGCSGLVFMRFYKALIYQSETLNAKSILNAAKVWFLLILDPIFVIIAKVKYLSSFLTVVQTSTKVKYLSLVLGFRQTSIINVILENVRMCQNSIKISVSFILSSCVNFIQSELFNLKSTVYLKLQPKWNIQSQKWVSWQTSSKMEYQTLKVVIKVNFVSALFWPSVHAGVEGSIQALLKIGSQLCLNILTSIKAEYQTLFLVNIQTSIKMNNIASFLRVVLTQTKVNILSIEVAEV